MSPVALPSKHALVLYGPKDLRLDHRTLWPPTHDQAQVAIMATGLCGSDLHYYLHGRNGDFAIRDPLVLGHESAGIITALGSGVTHLRIGQRVAIEAGVMCGECELCAKGRYNLCKAMRFCSSAKTYPHLDGTLQERMNHPARLLHPIPDNVSLTHAALAEPLSVLLHASRRAALQPSQHILVLGVGAIGLLACLVARARGASRIVAIDINPQRLAFAKDEGFADQVFCLPAPSPPGVGERPKSIQESLKKSYENAMTALKVFDAPEGFDVVFECTGAEPSTQLAIHACKPGAKILLIGMGASAATLPLAAALTKEVELLGSFRYANTYPEALGMLSEGRVSAGMVEKLVTQRVGGLRGAREGFEWLARGRDNEGRVVVKVVVMAEGVEGV